MGLSVVTEPTHGERPTLAALWLEFLDVVPLCFPFVIDDATITFARTDADPEFAPTQVHATADNERPGPQDLGYDEREVFGTLQTIFADLLPFIDDGVHVRHEYVVHVTRVRETGDVAIHVTGNASPAPVHTHLVKKRERDQLFHTAALFHILARNRDNENQQRAYVDAARSGAHNFALAEDDGTVRFIDAAGAVTKVCSASILGSYHPSSRTLLWAYENQALAPSLTRHARRVKEMYDDGLRVFLAPEVPCAPTLAERLCRAAAVHIGAQGLFATTLPGPHGALLLFIALFEAGA
jgi:hypothetical protein